MGVRRTATLPGLSKLIARPSGVSTLNSKRRLSEREHRDDVSHEINKENEGQSRVSTRSHYTALGSSALSNTVQSGIGAADKVVVLKMLGRQIGLSSNT